MSVEPPFSSVNARRHKFGKRVGGDLNTRSLEIDRYLAVVTWLALFGTVVAGALVITSSEISDAIWLFNQVP
jgi:hypothetical protein